MIRRNTYDLFDPAIVHDDEFLNELLYKFMFTAKDFIEFCRKRMTGKSRLIIQQVSSLNLQVAAKKSTTYAV